MQHGQDKELNLRQATLEVCVKKMCYIDMMLTFSIALHKKAKMFRLL